MRDEKNIRRFSLFPKTLSRCIEPVTRPVFKAKGLASSKMLTEWPQVVGASLAAHSMPEKISFPPGKKTEGTLTISVENGFATQMQHMQPVILERMTGYFGYKAVTRIAISHTYVPPVATAEVPVAQRNLSLSAESLGMVNDIEDPELKAALQSLAGTLEGKNT